MPVELRSSTARAIILPEFGGRLHQLFIPCEGSEEQILYAPAEVDAYRERPTRGGGFPMAPWPNRIAGSRCEWRGVTYEVPSEGKPNAIHGRVLDKPWVLLAQTPSSVELECEFDSGWPWRGRTWQRFELSGGALSMRLEVRSDGGTFPAGCGWHPWFRRDAFRAKDVRVRVPANRRYVLEAQLPTGETLPPAEDFDLRPGLPLGLRRLDDCYTEIDGAVTIDWGRQQLAITVDCPEPHVEVYTPSEAFCIEPQTCAPDAFNLAARGLSGVGFALAEPAHPVSISSVWSWV